MSDSNQQYDASSIQSLSGREHVRKRPGMYFGGTDQRALHSMLYEFVDNAFNQIIHEQATTVKITLQDDYQVTVQDDGAGIPVEIYDKTGISTLELIFTQMGACRWRGERHVRRYNVGIAPTNALSEILIVQVKRDDYLWQRDFTQGLPNGELEQVRSLEDGESTGTTITFKPDFSILQQHDFDYFKLLNRLHEYVYLVPEATIIFEDMRTNPQGASSTTIHHPHGLAEYVEYLNRDYTAIHPALHLQKTMEFSHKNRESETYEVTVDLALQYGSCATAYWLGFANTHETMINSRCLQIIASTVVQQVRNFAVDNQLTNEPQHLSRDDILAGLCFVLNIWHPDPQSETSRGFKLMNPSASDASEATINELFEQLIASQDDTLSKIVAHCLNNRKLREERRFSRGGK